MPVTPFHMGPAALIKAALRNKFSISIFSFSQVLIDLQLLFAMLGADIELHGISHTLIGATFIAIISFSLGKPICQSLLKYWNHSLALSAKDLLFAQEFISWKVAIFSAFIGTYSHLLFDSFMHADLEVFYPLQINNPLLGLISISNLHISFAIAGLVGTIIYFLSQYFIQKRN